MGVGPDSDEHRCPCVASGEQRLYRGEVYLVGAEGTVRTLLWSPNRLRFQVDIRKPGKLIVNQNFYPAWRSADGRRLRSHAALLSLRVTPQDRTIELYYRRDSFYIGAAISLLCWIGLLVLVQRSRAAATSAAQ
jgi:hypothetical protein